MDSIFPPIRDKDDPPKSFQELWNILDRNKTKYEYLRAFQQDVLENLDREMKKEVSKDFAVALPTGTGKTVIGLLLSYNIMLTEKRKALYLCPTVFLCNQVKNEADKMGIPAVLLNGRWVDIPESSKSKFLSGEAVGVAPYSTLFNSDPKVGDLGLIIMDDIHAAGEAVINNWSIKITEKENTELFKEISEVITHILNKSQRTALDTKPPEETYDMLYSRQLLPLVDDILQVFELHEKEPVLVYKMKRVRAKLENYFCILHYKSIEFRPLTPPSFTLREFKDAKYRIYMSATPDTTGNLENELGIEKLKWIPINGIDVPGNRLILNLNLLMPTLSDESRVTGISQKVNKLVLLTQSEYYQSVIKNALINTKYSGVIFSPMGEQIETDMEKFKSSSKSVIILAGRYDGIDLGDGHADGIVLYHLPAAINAFENFTTSKWEKRDEAKIRAIQRVHQGMGRCTRRDSDQVIIFLIGEDLVKFMLDPQTILKFPGRLKEELGYCKSIKDPNQLDLYIGEVLNKGNSWKQFKMNINKRAAKNTQNTINIENSGNDFIFSKYSAYLWNGRYDVAQSLAKKLMEKMESKKEGVRSAIWAYLYGVASDIEAFENGANPYSKPGNDGFLKAENWSEKREWFGNLSNFTYQKAIQPDLKPRVETIYNFLRSNDLEIKFSGAIDHLKSGEDSSVKSFLKTFGESLGFQTDAPKRQGAPDCIWLINSQVAFIFEAKTMKKNDFLSIEEVRQITSLPNETKTNEKVTLLDDLLPICITDVKKIAKEKQDSDSKFYVLRTKELEELAIKWFDRLKPICQHSYNDSEFFKLRIQQALLTQSMDDKQLRVKLCRDLAKDVLVST